MGLTGLSHIDVVGVTIKFFIVVLALVLGRAMIEEISGLDIVQKAVRYLPGLRRKRIYYTPWWSGVCPERGSWGPVLACTIVYNDACLLSSRVSVDVLAKHYTTTLLHELIHCAGGDEISAYNLVSALAYAIHSDLPGFDLLRLFSLSPEDIDMAARATTGMGIWEIFRIEGTIPFCAKLVFDERQGLKLEPKPEMKKEDLTICLVTEIVAGIGHNTVMRRVFEKILEYLA